MNPGGELAAEAKRARLASKPHPNDQLPPGETNAYEDSMGVDNQDLDEMLYARHAEVENLEDLTNQRGTNIPALYNQVYRFIQNPSTVSTETFKRMWDTDETVGSGLDFFTTCAAARLSNYTHKSPEIAAWVNERLHEIDGGWMNAQKEIMTAAGAGFSVAEKVWANTQNGFVPKKLIQLPPGTVMFETDRTGSMTQDGILQYQRNYNPALFGSGISYMFGFSSPSAPSGASHFRQDAYAKLGDYPFPLRSPNIFSYLSIRIPTRKCIHASGIARLRWPIAAPPSVQALDPQGCRDADAGRGSRSQGNTAAGLVRGSQRHVLGSNAVAAGRRRYGHEHGSPRSAGGQGCAQARAQ